MMNMIIGLIGIVAAAMLVYLTVILLGGDKK